MKIFIGNDHAAPIEKLKVVEFLKNKGYQVEDCGIAEEEKADYPDIAKIVAEKVLENKDHKGVLICGTGIGMSMKANRYKGIRAALLENDFCAKATREHNNANIACFGARVITTEKMCELLEIFLTTEFEGGRHQTRVEKIDD
jgi:ribose 5-phosphate isomerase B